MADDYDAANPCGTSPFAEGQLFANWDEQLGSSEKPPDVLVGELLMYYFEWMASTIVSNVQAKAVHALVSLLLPGDHNVPGWYHLKGMLDYVYTNTVRAVELCPNDHIAFIDCVHPKLGWYQHSHRTRCPKCGAARTLEDEFGRRVPAKVGYYFSLDPFLLNIFKERDLYDYMDQSTGEFPPGHTRHSKGWHDKMRNNPHMNGEPRNQGLIAMADGIPLFRDKNSRSVIPIAVRLGNQPDTISKKFNHIHLSALYPCDFWVVDKDTGLLKREKHKPSHIGPLQVLLVEDLLYWYEGKTAVDYSLAENDPARIFNLRAALLFWCGDYPGLGEITNFSHAGYHACHWCKEVGEYSISLNRTMYTRYKR